ncbi:MULTISPECIES: 2-keto-4-pentenoate hydratase [Acinetobacter]|jgi:2-keto-4-pentenoate hydratase|uniref:2-keto-4-pentenoate hydratase n=1 Tax=Acinetobacter TaxID=469 RepID=UPI000B3CAC94|nr:MULTISPECIES: fumarylacetoacetate hydrolase family protein [Acinetobacter]AXY59609.1 2-keto-4-pentenoate hydratase [Acinetobacter sp. WCHAc010052]WOE42623.1 fumarylacetoacetate hydrolase family protein [Acinetobacter chinensis]
MSAIEHAIADTLYHAEKNRTAIAPVREQLGHEATADHAYAVQDINTQRALNNGRRLVGKKIGLTSFAVQKQLGVDSPDFGMLFDDMAYADGQVIPFSKLIQPKVEAEIALVLKADLTQKQHSIEDIIAATDYAVAAIEIVDSRIENWKISLLDTVADNASSAAFVLGSQKMQLTDVDLVNCRMQMICASEVVSEGIGKACLDHPLNAAVWLADEMVKRGRPLQAGDIVLTGALGPMVAVQAGESYQVNIDGFGSVTAAFSV